MAVAARTARSRRRRGRPTARDQRAVRDQLLGSARDLFLKYGYRAVSARQVAARAGVDPAMVQYYFRSKRGLYLAMLDTVVSPLRTALEQMVEPGDAAPDPEGTDLGRFLEMYMRAIAANPWIPALLIREVLPAEGAFRQDFVQAIVQPMVARLRRVIVRAQQDGRIDPALAPEHVLISTLSLGMWPFLVRPVLSRALGVTLDGESLDALIAHTRGVVARGVLAFDVEERS